jgi:Fe-S oxidoreductase
MLGIAPGENLQTEDTVATLGAKDVTDLTWKNLMDAYTCTECGRCTAQCPANQTGKLLSPRKIMMDTRDRLEEFGNNKEDSDVVKTKTLLGDYITKEEIFACTTCNACVEACPVLIDPVSIIISLRRYMSMEESSAPSDWNAMFSNIETGFSPWKFPVSDRFKWAQEIIKEEK